VPEANHLNHLSLCTQDVPERYLPNDILEIGLTKFELLFAKILES